MSSPEAFPSDSEGVISSSSSSPSSSPPSELPLNFLSKSLRSSALFSSINNHISQEDLNSLLSKAYAVSYPPNTPLIQQNQPSPPSSSPSAPPLLILSSGEVHVVVTKHSHPPTIVSTVKPSDLIGDQLLLSSSPPSASIVTASNVLCYALPLHEVERFIERHEEVKENVRKRKWLWSAVSKVPQFKDLDDDIRKEALIGQFRREEVAGGQEVVRYGDPGDRFYVIEKGLCDVRVPSYVTTSAISTLSSTPSPPPPPTPPPAPSPPADSDEISPFSPSQPPSPPSGDIVVATKGPSDYFGEIALLYSVSRCATVTCTSPSCTLWSIDAEQFRAACTEGSLWLKTVFYQNASVRDSKTGDVLMTDKDFFRAVKSTLHDRKQKKKVRVEEEESEADDPKKKKNALSERQLRLMFRLADQSGDNLISFSEFVLLNSLLTTPLSKWQFAFRLFDRDKSGSIDRDEFIQVVKSLTVDKHGNKHDYSNDPFINELFGPPSTSPKRKALTYAQFEDLLSRDVLPTWLHSVKHDLRSVDDYWMRWNQVMNADNSVGMISASGAFTFPSWKSLVAGGVAGAVSRTAVSPLERIKLLFQMQGVPPKYTSMLQAMKLIWREDGFKGFFNGNLANVIRITPTSAFQFYFYDLFKRVFFPSKKELSPVERLLAGGLAGCSALVLTYPLDLIRARLTLQSGSHKQYKGIVHGLTTVVKEEGPLALYRGLWPSVAGIFPYIGIDFAVYETLKGWLPHNEWFRSSHGQGDPKKHALLGCGAIAGVVGQTLAYPLDLVRRRMQVMGWGTQTSYHYKGGIWATMKQIKREEGIRGLYRGMIPNYYKVVPAVSISFVTYELMRDLLDM